MTTTTDITVSKTAAVNELKRRRHNKANPDDRKTGTNPDAVKMSKKELVAIAGDDASKGAVRRKGADRDPVKAAAAEAANQSGEKPGSKGWWTVYKAFTAKARAEAAEANQDYPALAAVPG